MDLRDAVTLHQLSLHAEGRSPATLRLYRLYEQRFLEYLDERHIAPVLEALQPLHVRAAVEWFRARGLGHRGGQVAVHTFVATLKTWASFLEREGVWNDSPLRRLGHVRVPKVLRQPYTDQEVMALWGASQQTRTPARDEALLLLLLDTGMRIGELTTLTLDNLKLDERHLVVGLEGKGRRERLVPLGDPTKVGGGRTMTALRRYLRERDILLERWPHRRTDRVFLTAAGYPLTAEGGTDIIKRLGKIASVAEAGSHRCRHTFASLYLTIHPGDELGLRRIIGHASPAVTADYVHLSQSTIASRSVHASVIETMASTPRADARGQARQRRGQPLRDAWGVIREPLADPPEPNPDRRTVVQRARGSAPIDRDALIDAVKTDPELRKALLQALIGAA